MFPDFRPDHNCIFLPRYTWKSEILHPKEKRDWLLNLFFSKPDYADVHRKVYYAGYFGAKAGGGALTYGIVAASVANMRGQKDDAWNHLIAGASIGFIGGYANKSSAAGAITAVIFGIGGVLLKQFYVTGRSLTQFADKGELNFMEPETHDYRYASIWLNSFDTKTRSERYW
ncbi:hypothetical protein RDWZM_003570 [Blomia tropicalis]|uniref:Uncharacterized protein n=1 Tax=Blomia tropicalis TaxID=40697 RepID=A0A9Q0RST4_BLOTA|nr:hypothetical protein RDWZM_003570 [Blomia tropicalis]